MATRARTKEPRAAGAVDPSIEYLRARLAVLELRVAAAVARRRAADPNPDDQFRGLYISDDQVDALLAEELPAAGLTPPDPDAASLLQQAEAAADAAEKRGADIRLRRLARAFGLDAGDVEILLVALAPDFDPRFERLYG
ncbi:MAG: ATP-binding protein, partial [Acidimicrobiia bacterium]